jgi:hydroxymethylpyrimidine/phosphomethylpyrimidine kinase
LLHVTSRRVPFVLAVGGSDPTAGAGVEADVRTLESFGVGSAVAITAIAVQDGVRVRTVRALAPALVAEQMKAAFDAVPIAVVKCGMLARPAIAAAVARVVRARGVPLVLDPVLRASGGEALGSPALMRALVNDLVPLARVITPNLAEASALASRRVDDVASMESAARAILGLGARAVVVKGGHLSGVCVDVLADGRRVSRFSSPRIDGDMHGTGCAFASALAAGLARGFSLRRSVEMAREHVRQLLKGTIKLARGARLRAPRP